MTRQEEANQQSPSFARCGRAVAVAVAIVLWCGTDMQAGTATGRSTAKASCSVSVTIPRLTGIDLSMPPIARVASGGERIAVRLFETGPGAVLVRTTPHESAANSIQTVSLKHDVPSAQVIGATTGGGWQEFDDALPDSRAQRTSSKPQRKQVTYEVWKF